MKSVVSFSSVVLVGVVIVRPVLLLSYAQDVGRPLLALVCDDGCNGTCVVNCRRKLLSFYVGACFFVGGVVLERGFVGICLVGHSSGRAAIEAGLVGGRRMRSRNSWGCAG